MNTRARALAAVASLAVALATAQVVEAAAGARLRVMTFNIRYDFETDGPNRWQHRVAAVAQVIRGSGAAVIGLQEDKGEQIDDLRPLLPGYELLGRGRNATGSGERCSIAVKAADVRVRESGSFWLSDTPEEPGSNTWGDKYPRVVTWALLEPKKSKVKLCVLNAHLPEGNDGRAQDLRRRGAAVMHAWIRARLRGKEKEKLAFVLLGDYNSQPDEEVRKALLGDDGAALPLRDAYDEARPKERWPGTVNNEFSGATNNSRIDWILLAGPIRALAYQKVDEQVEGRWPSDHYPVFADLELR